MGDEDYEPLKRLLREWQQEKGLPPGEARTSDYEAQTRASIAWVRAKWGDDKQCPWCGNDSYYVSPPEPLALGDGGQTAPYISVTCRNCGQVTRIDLRIFDPGQTGSGEPEDEA